MPKGMYKRTQAHRDAIAAGIKAKRKPHKKSEEHIKAIATALKGRKQPNISAGVKRHWESLTPEQKFERMEKVNRNSMRSSIERFVEGRIRAKNITYVRQKWIGKYRVDFFLPDYNAIIEAYGCYWHQCPICKCECGLSDRTVEEVRQYDEERVTHLKSKGYHVKIFWEHDIKRLMKGDAA